MGVPAGAGSASMRMPVPVSCPVRAATAVPTLQGPAERAGERGHPDRGAGGTGGHGEGGQRGFQHGRVRRRLRWHQRAPVGGSCGRAEKFGGVKVEDLAQPFEEPQGHVVVIGVGPQPAAAGQCAAADPVGELGVGEAGEHPPAPGRGQRISLQVGVLLQRRDPGIPQQLSHTTGM